MTKIDLQGKVLGYWLCRFYRQQPGAGLVKERWPDYGHRD